MTYLFTASPGSAVLWLLVLAGSKDVACSASSPRDRSGEFAAAAGAAVYPLAGLCRQNGGA